MSDLSLREQRRLWLQNHVAALAVISQKTGLSRDFVRDVFEGQSISRTREVEQRLKELGAPGFADDPEDAT